MKISRFTLATFSLLIYIISYSACFSEPANGNEGTLYIIGGGRRPATMISEMVSLAGGENSNILVISTASGDPADVGTYQRDQFLEYGAGQVQWIHITRENANTDTVLEAFENLTGIFFSGGDQRRLADAMNDTESLKMIKQLYQEGALIAGTSAGAAIMSKVMITGTELANPDSTHPFGDLLADNIEVRQGFGLIETAIIDQHHIRRKRFNRLVSTVLEHPDLLGIGIDESTALIVHGNGMAEISGERCVYILDASKATKLRRDANNHLTGQDLSFHILSDGDVFDLNRKTPGQ
jgi:cyanophycinase